MKRFLRTCLAEIETLAIELTDVSDEAMASVATLAKLRRLVIYGGRPGVTERGLAALKGRSSLEVLELINTRLADEGLRVLHDFPNLRSLTLSYEPRLGGHLTDAGLAHLKDLPKLETLRLTGGWASPAALAELRSSLQKCKVFTDGSDQD